MISKLELAMMKPDSILINTSRGGIVDEQALIESLAEGGIAGAGLDVLENEPPSESEPLRKLNNAIVTPHTAGPTLESLPKRAINSFDNMKRVWEGQDPLWTAEFDTPD
jgi:D-3-phosphoglycerate dehydrogenase